MITNLFKRLYFRINRHLTLSVFSVIFIFQLFSVSTVIYSQVKADAGKDLITGLCYLSTLDGSASVGEGLTGTWRLIEGPESVTILPMDPLNSIIQAFEGGEYHFELTVTDINSISDKDTVVYTFMDIKAEVSDDIVIGGCTSVVLDATKGSTLGEGYSFEWYDASKLSDNSATPTFTPTFRDFNTTVKFYFTVRDTFGCEAVDEFNITVKDIPVADINSAVTEINCDTIELNAIWSDGYNISYHWSPVENLSPDTNNPQFVKVSNEIPTVKLVVEDAVGCKDSAIFNLNSYRHFAHAGDDIVTGTCANLLFAGSATSGTDVTWYPNNLVTSTFNPTTARVRATDIRRELGLDTTKTFPIYIESKKENGCIKRDTAFLNVTNTNLLFTAGPNLQTGICGTTLQSSIQSEYFSSYNWTGNAFSLPINQNQSQKIQPFVQFTNQQALTNQILSFNTVDIFGCRRTDNVVLNVDRPPVITIPVSVYETNGCKPVQLNINTNNIDSISWTPSSDLSDPNAEDPIYLGSKARNLTVTGFDRWGCSTSSNIVINSNPLVIDAGTNKTTTQYSSVWVGSGLKIDGYSTRWSLAENYSGVTLEHSDSTFCLFTSETMGTFKLYYLFTDDQYCFLKDSVEVLVNFANRPPVIESISADTLFVYSGNEIRFDFTFSSPDDDEHTVEWNIEGKVFGSTSATTPVFNDGWAVASVSDPYTTVKDSLFYSIKPRDPVIINGIAKEPDVVFQNTTFSVTGDATSPYGEEIMYSWQFNSNKQIGQSVSYSALEEGWLILTASDIYTQTMDSLYIEITPRQQVTINSISVEPDSFYVNDPITLSVDATSPYTENLSYSWLIDGSTYLGEVASVNLTNPSWAVVSVTDGFTRTKDSIFVNFTPEQAIEPFNIHVSPNDTVCSGISMVVNVVATGKEKDRMNYRMILPDGTIVNSSEATFNALQSGYLKVTVFNTQFDRTDSLKIQTLTSEILTLPDYNVCQNSTVEVSLGFEYESKGMYQFWQEGSEITTSETMEIPFAQAGFYTIASENIFGCTDTAFVSIKQVKKPVAVDDELRITEEFQSGSLDIGVNDTAVFPAFQLLDLPYWGAASLNSNGILSFESNLIAFNLTDTIHYLISETLCPEVADSGLIIVTIANAPPLAENNINAFSPNGDMINQYFTIENIEFYPENELYVFNNGGNLVYYKKNYNNLWDGKRNRGVGIGRELPSGTYFYVLKANGHSIINGFVELRR